MSFAVAAANTALYAFGLFYGHERAFSPLELTMCLMFLLVYLQLLAVHFTWLGIAAFDAARRYRRRRGARARAAAQGRCRAGALPRRGAAAQGRCRAGALPRRGAAAQGRCCAGALPRRGAAAQGRCRAALVRQTPRVRVRRRRAVMNIDSLVGRTPSVIVVDSLPYVSKCPPPPTSPPRGGISGRDRARQG